MEGKKRVEGGAVKRRKGGLLGGKMGIFVINALLHNQAQIIFSLLLMSKD